MVEFVDVFGTDNLYNNTSDPNSQLDDIKNYIENTVEPDVTGSTSSDSWGTGVFSDVVTLNKCEGAFSCSDLNERRKEAENYLSSNHSEYDSASVCVVVDHWGKDILGYSVEGGWNVQGSKTVIVDTGVSISDDPATNYGQIAAHEIGHTLSADHNDTAVYYNSNLGYYSATHMWTPPIDGTSTECDNGDNTDTLDDSFSNCSIQTIDKTL